MVDLNEHTMMFTLNGEVLLDDSGSELAFKDFEVGEGRCFTSSSNTYYTSEDSTQVLPSDLLVPLTPPLVRNQIQSELWLLLVMNVST